MPTAGSHTWRSIVLCFSGATLLWFLKAFSEVYTTTINYPIYFVADPSHEVLNQTPSASVALEVTGSGWRLLRYLLNLNVQPIEIPAALISNREHNSEYLRTLFDQKIKDLTVRNVLFDKTFSASTLPQSNHCDN